jgi:hypothetical protein
LLERVMPRRRLPNTEISYALVSFDEDGAERTDDRDAPGGCFSEKVIDEIRAHPPTDIFMFSHGWKGDVAAAVSQYDDWIGALVNQQADRARMQSRPGGFVPVFIGLHWPSLPWGDEEIGAGTNFAVQGSSVAALVELYAKRLADTPEVRAALELIFGEARTNAAADALTDKAREAYFQLDKSLNLGENELGGPPEADREPFDPDAAVEASLDLGSDFGGQDLGGAILSPLRQLSFWTMKKRARKVGEGGMHDLLKRVQTVSANSRVHLMGHSFGCIVVSSMLGGPGCTAPLVRPVDSFVLVQGAMSLWSFASDIPLARGTDGYFRRVLADEKVRGPIVATISKFDTAVGRLYPAAAWPAGQVAFAGLPKYGAIGAFGIRGVDGDAFRKMLAANEDYGFDSKRVYNLESSQFICKGEGLSGAHSDIGGPEVAHTIWQSALV